MGKSFFGAVIGNSETVNVMGDFMDQDIVKVVVSKIVNVSVAMAEWMCAEEDTRPPVYSIATERTRPGALLFTGSREKEYHPQIREVFGRHLPKAVFDVSSCACMPEIGCERRKSNDLWE